MKIHIIGPSGSGKTFLSHQLSAKYQITAYELDDLFWDNRHGTARVKRNAAERDAMLQEILQQPNWIIEGVQHTWVTPCFAQADMILFLQPPALLCRFRIIRRFLHRKLKGISRENETLQSLMHLLKWTGKFYRINLPEIKDTLLPYKDKVLPITCKKELSAYLES